MVFMYLEPTEIHYIIMETYALVCTPVGKKKIYIVTVGALLNLNSIYSKIGKKKKKWPRERRKKSLPWNIL